MAEITGYRPRDWGSHPPYLYEPYGSSLLRAPRKPLIALRQTLSEITGPIFGHDAVEAGDRDLTRNAGTGGEAIGERMIVTGRVLDEDGRPVPNTLIEVWQTNAAGRYFHAVDQHDAPLDPNFIGAGRCLTDEKGEYRFLTIRPGAYPWRNHPNAWRPAHIHFSLLAPSFVTRLVTQMFFPGDPLLPLDPILNSISSEGARQRLVAAYDHNVTEPEWALGYRFDIALRGREATPFEKPNR
jgi:protocatechuate 3,4-dioxygenase beta subunit